MQADRPCGLVARRDGPGVRVARAPAFYKDQSVSLGKAAKLANMAPAECMQCASRHGIATIRGTVRSALEDARTLDAWLKKRSCRATPARSPGRAVIRKKFS